MDTYVERPAARCAGQVLIGLSANSYERGDSFNTATAQHIWFPPSFPAFSETQLQSLKPVSITVFISLPLTLAALRICGLGIIAYPYYTSIFLIVAHGRLMIGLHHAQVT